ncbi:glycosyltransferase [Planctomycetota bacterium]
MKKLSENGTVLYVNSIVIQKPKISQGKKFIHKLVRKTKSVFRGLKKTEEGFWVYSPFSLPVYHISWLRPLNNWLVRLQVKRITRRLDIHNPIIWMAGLGACEIAIDMKRNKLIYQRTDCFEEFPDIDTKIAKEYDQKIKAAADLVIYANKMLYEKELKHCRKTIYVDHGVDFEMFATAEKSEDVPSDIRKIKKPIVGFYGQIDDYTVDIEFIKKVVDYMPDWSFVFIGGTIEDCSSLEAKDNVWMLGMKPYEQIPHYGKCFDVAIMPWKQNDWIQACNPVKLKEYLALGKPIVSTPFTELQRYQDVTYVAQTPEEFAESIKKAFLENNMELVTKRRQKIAHHSWESKAEKILQEIFNEK